MISLLKYVGTGQQLDMIAARSTLVIVTIAVSFQLNLKAASSDLSSRLIRSPPIQSADPSAPVTRYKSIPSLAAFLLILRFNVRTTCRLYW